MYSEALWNSYTTKADPFHSCWFLDIWSCPYHHWISDDDVILSGCTGFFTVQTITCVLNLSCRKNKERERGGEEAWAARTNGNLILRVHAHECMWEADRRARGRERERDGREKEGKMQFQITCACAAAWVGMCWRERGRVWKGERERGWKRVEMMDFLPGSDCVNRRVWHNVGYSHGDTSTRSNKLKPNGKQKLYY